MTAQQPVDPTQAAVSGARGWFKSSFSTGSCTCVEVDLDGEPERVRIRDSKQDSATDGQPTIAVAHDEWPRFIAMVTDRTGVGRSTVVATPTEDGSTTVCCTSTGISLLFDKDEWRAFVAGATRGEFNL